jgi:predicted transcriptional regulator
MRANADARNQTKRTICTQDVIHVGPDDDVGDMIDLMARNRSARPGMRGRQAVGIITLGDLAIEREARFGAR